MSNLIPSGSLPEHFSSAVSSTLPGASPANAASPTSTTSSATSSTAQVALQAISSSSGSASSSASTFNPFNTLGRLQRTTSVNVSGENVNQLGASLQLHQAQPSSNPLRSMTDPKARENESSSGSSSLSVSGTSTPVPSATPVSPFATSTPTSAASSAVSTPISSLPCTPAPVEDLQKVPMPDLFGRVVVPRPKKSNHTRSQSLRKIVFSGDSKLIFRKIQSRLTQNYEKTPEQLQSKIFQHLTNYVNKSRSESFVKRSESFVKWMQYKIMKKIAEDFASANLNLTRLKEEISEIITSHFTSLGLNKQYQKEMDQLISNIWPEIDNLGTKVGPIQTFKKPLFKKIEYFHKSLLTKMKKTPINPQTSNNYLHETSITRLDSQSTQTTVGQNDSDEESSDTASIYSQASYSQASRAQTPPFEEYPGAELHTSPSSQPSVPPLQTQNQLPSSTSTSTPLTPNQLAMITATSTTGRYPGQVVETGQVVENRSSSSQVYASASASQSAAATTSASTTPYNPQTKKLFDVFEDFNKTLGKGIDNMRRLTEEIEALEKEMQEDLKNMKQANVTKQK